jgi:hypothetical protein
MSTPMSTPTFTLAVTADELAILRDALGVTSAIKAAEGHAEVARVLNSLRERADQVDQRSSFARGRGSAVHNSVSGPVAGGVIQVGDITGGIRF